MGKKAAMPRGVPGVSPSPTNLPPLAPSLQFSGSDEGSTSSDNSATPFGMRVMAPTSKPGLVGLNPALIQDPRFDYSMKVSSKPTEGANTAGFQLVKTAADDAIGLTHIANDSPKFITDLDDKTVANDMWAVTLGGKSGTSPGDQADPFFVKIAQHVVGNAKQITPEMVQRLKQIMLEARYPDFRQMHVGPGWAPGMDPNTPANPIEWPKK